jgi:hypothetical protein
MDREQRSNRDGFLRANQEYIKDENSMDAPMHGVEKSIAW